MIGPELIMALNNRSNHYDDMQMEMAIQRSGNHYLEEMTYEEMLALQEQIGNVNIGLSEEEINAIPIKRVFTKETCTVC